MDKITEALRSWKTLNEFLKEADEKQAYALLNAEQIEQQRLQFLIRIYGHYSKLRTRRERLEIVKGAK